MTAISDSRVLVTGAAGFVGSHLTQALVERGHHVRALVHYDSRPGLGNLDLLPRALLSEIEVVHGDINDLTFVSRSVAGCDTVFHLAALISVAHSFTQPQAYLQTNAIGTLNIAQSCLDRGVRRLIHTSTSECYGTALTVPMTEAHPLQALSPYAASKIAADKVIESFCTSFGLPAVTVRPFNTYGPRQSARAAIPAILAQLMNGCAELRLGNTSATRDFLYVDDSVQGYLRAASAEETLVQGKVIQLCTGEERSIHSVAEIAMEKIGRKVPIITDTVRLRPSEVDRLCGDPAVAKSLLGWHAAHSLSDGLKATAEFMLVHKDQYSSREYRV